MKIPDNLISVMNDTKWEELRFAMSVLEPLPAYRTKCWQNSFESHWDCEWFYHFRECGYAVIEWVEIRTESEQQRRRILSALSKIHVPTDEISVGFRVYGYVKIAQSIQYAQL